MKTFFIRYSIILFVTILTFSCSSNEEIESYFPNAISITGENVGPVDFFLRPTRCLIDSSFILVSDSKTDHFFHIFDENFKLKESIISQGSGPNEILSAAFSQQEFVKNKSLILYDVYQNAICTFGFLNTQNFEIAEVEKTRVPNEILNVQNIQFVEDNIYVARGCLDAGKMCVFNSETNDLKFIPFYPDIRFDITSRDFYDKFNGDQSYNRKQEKLVCSNRYFNQLEIYSISGDLLKEIRLDKLVNPFIDADYKYFYNAIYTTSKYIYASYLGVSQKQLSFNGMKNRTSQMHVFDWKGNPIVLLNLDRLTGYFAVNEQNEHLICVDEMNMNQPFVFYELPDILN